jgi:hypothetical protein
MRLAIALCAHRSGIPDPLLAVKGKRSTKDSIATMSGRMWVALAYECLRRQGLPHRDIAREIAKHSALMPLLRGKNASLKTSPKSWYDQFTTEKDIGPIRTSWFVMYSMLGLSGDDWPPERCRETARICLSRATAIAKMSL